MGRVSQPRCPTCGAANDPEARQCLICGAALAESPRRISQRAQTPTPQDERVYDSHEGEDDLLAQGISSTPLGAAFGFVLLVMVLFAAGAGAFLALDGDDSSDDVSSGSAPLGSESPAPSRTASITPQPTNTRAAPVNFPSVTPMPATATATETPGPCIKTAGAEDTIYGLALECGHRDFSIVNVIIEMNDGLDCETCLREGQTIEIPLPTATPGGETATAEDTQDDDVESGSTGQGQSDAALAAGESDVAAAATVPVNEFGTPDLVATLRQEPTLRPGLMWHTVEQDETMISIAVQYGIDAKIISDVNPEIEFGQCDFSERFGGEACTVMIYEGQRIRVPAPTSTPTSLPSPSGSETPTPSPSPTFNVPSANQPPDDTRFDANSLITLRWTATGSLAPNEFYQVSVRNLDTGEAYQGRTTDLFFVVPADWQPTDGGSQGFEWSVSIVVIQDGQVQSMREATVPRQFFWQGRSR
ncbi:MAG: LysM peptidoglycan-binding domain-containing protein [Chloroflexi bacterium]|nr:LysM peptidoglycan-binding domain-containing protein [Chloroflexota bacterium]